MSFLGKYFRLGEATTTTTTTTATSSPTTTATPTATTSSIPTPIPTPISRTISTSSHRVSHSSPIDSKTNSYVIVSHPNMSAATAEKGVEKLTVVSTPERSLAFTNHAYVSPSSTLAPRSRTATDNSYVLVQSSTTSHVFIVKAHANVNDGEIAINAIQRGSLKMSQGTSTAKCSPFTIPKEGFAIIKTKMVIDLIGKRHSKVSESALAEFIRDAFVNHVFTKEQEFVLDYMGTPLKVTIQTITVPTTKEVSEKKGDQLTTFGDRGILNSTSMLTIEAIPNKFLEFEADAHAAGGAVTDVFDPDWTFEDMGIGGLDTEFKTIFRRAFASRVFPPAIIQQLGIKHVKGMLLYGPPGTGKTLIARQIARLIDRKGKVPPKVVNGPEVLNKFVGASEEKIRELFADAEADYKARKENADLHIIIFDEIDAICKARGTAGGGTGVHDTVVNQLLTKIDGVDSPNNILVIGMTNRKDMLDPALLRPGRLEVHVEISLPDEQGRVQILSIHTRHMSENGKLAPDVDLPHLASITKNFSGAELEGLVKSAASYALSESIDIGGQEAKTRDSNIMVKQAHFLQAREEMHPAFGVSEDELKEICDLPEAHNGPICYSREYEKLLNTVRTVIKTLQSPDNKSTHLMSLLLEGPHSSGKTATAAYLALESQFPYAKVISPEQYIGYSEASKAAAIFKIFDDAYKSPFSLVILDKIEALIEYTPVGPRFSNTILQALQVLIAKKPIKGRKMLILATSAAPMMISDLQFRSNFDITLKLPALKTAQEVATVFISLNIECEEAPIQLAEEAMLSGVEIPIGKLLQAIDMAKQRASPIQLHHFKDCLAELGLDGDDMLEK